MCRTVRKNTLHMFTYQFDSDFEWCYYFHKRFDHFSSVEGCLNPIFPRNKAQALYLEK